MGLTTGNVQLGLGQYVPGSALADYFQHAQATTISGAPRMADGTKPMVICGGVGTEAKDMDDAQRIAEEQAHSKGANAYILKPVRKVAPKRDVVTTELA